MLGGFKLDKLKYIRIQQENNQYNGDIPIGADAENIDLTNGNNLQDTIGNYDYRTQGSFKQNFDSYLKYNIKASTTDIEV